MKANYKYIISFLLNTIIIKKKMTLDIIELLRRKGPAGVAITNSGDNQFGLKLNLAAAIKLADLAKPLRGIYPTDPGANPLIPLCHAAYI